MGWLAPVLSVVVAATVSGCASVATLRALRRRNRRNAEASLDGGSRARVYAALRRPGQGLGGRWRHGFLEVSRGEDPSWAPRRPRPGGRLTLPGFALDGERPHRRGEWWWVAPELTILNASDSDGPLEVGLFPEGLALVQDVLTPRAGPQRVVQPEALARMYSAGPRLSPEERAAWKRDIDDDGDDGTDPWERASRRGRGHLRDNGS